MRVSSKNLEGEASAKRHEDVLVKKTSQELQMLSSVTLNCQETKNVMNSGSQLSE